LKDGFNAGEVCESWPRLAGNLSSSTGNLSFDRIAESYESTRVLPAEIALRVAKLLCYGMRSDQWALDAGVGTGRLGRALAREHKNTVGVDIAQEMLAQAQAEMPNLALANLCALPFSDQSFGLILSVHVLHLIPNWRSALGELIRVLGPNGRLVLGFEEQEQPSVRTHYLCRAREQGLALRAPGATQGELEQALKEAGFEVAQRRPNTLRWQYSLKGDAQLTQLTERTFSPLWEVPDALHAELIETTTLWAQSRPEGLGQLDHISVRLLLLEATRK
jgi:ubiquinone/menaquinone biosynthesis C-methylase UbiE